MFNSRAVIKVKDFGHPSVMRKGWVVFWETPCWYWIRAVQSGEGACSFGLVLFVCCWYFRDRFSSLLIMLKTLRFHFNRCCRSPKPGYIVLGIFKTVGQGVVAFPEWCWQRQWECTWQSNHWQHSLQNEGNSPISSERKALNLSL